MFHHMKPHPPHPLLDFPPLFQHSSTSFANSETGYRSLIQNTVCKRHSSTNQLMSIRCFGWTCEGWEYAVLGKSSFPALLWANMPFIYPPEQITKSARFSGVCSGIYLQLSPEPEHIIHDSVKRAWSPVQPQSLNCHIPYYNYCVTWDRA